MAGVKTLQAAIEAILFTMGESVELSKIAKAIEQDEQTTEELLQDLMKKYESKNRGIRIIELDKSYQMCTKKEMYDYLIRVAKQPKKYTLTDVLLETMSIIAYKQPITKIEVEKIRGVKSDHAVNKLVEYGLVEEGNQLMIEFKKWYFRIYLFFVRILIVSMIIGISFPVHVFGTTSDHAGQNWKINVSSNERQVVPNELKQLYALSAVLMDADSGRILFSKNGQEERAMASTTKIMTCILALESSIMDSENQIVTVSDQAATQPKVHLGMVAGERFYLKDLLYSLMLESHNDSGVAIAEAVAGSVEKFADLMNQKARTIGCYSTYFITPNGLDAADSNGIHHTTAEDLARIMRYCIMNSKKQEEFLTITRTETYQFQDVEGKRSFSCYNHNAFLNMMDGALSGKTGFTSDAGYCYVGALRRDKRTFIVALLACGWPNNKSYKWSDMRTLMTYALEHYQYKTFEIELPVRQIFINNEIKARSDTIDYPGKNGTKIPLTANLRPISFLLKEDETISVDYEIPDQLDAPVRKGMQVGRIRCTLNDKLIREYPVYTTQNAEKRTFKKCVEYIFHLFSIQNSYQKAENIKKDQAR